MKHKKKQAIKRTKKRPTRQLIPQAEHRTCCCCTTMSGRRHRPRPPPAGASGLETAPDPGICSSCWAASSALATCTLAASLRAVMHSRGGVLCIRAVSPCQRVRVDGKREVQGIGPLGTLERVTFEARATTACEPQRGWSFGFRLEGFGFRRACAAMHCKPGGRERERERVGCERVGCERVGY